MDRWLDVLGVLASPVRSPPSWWEASPSPTPAATAAASRAPERRVRRLALLLAAAALGGCGSLSAEETAREWVDAVNAEDWKRACELSLTDDERECRRLLAGAYRDTRPRMRIEGTRRAGSALYFTVEEPNPEPEPTDGWTAYAPLEHSVERIDGEHRVHFEIAVIR